MDAAGGGRDLRETVFTVVAQQAEKPSARKRATSIARSIDPMVFCFFSRGRGPGGGSGVCVCVCVCVCIFYFSVFFWGSVFRIPELRLFGAAFRGSREFRWGSLGLLVGLASLVITHFGDL